MGDNRTQFQRSQTMRAVRGKDTGPELFIRRLLHRHGYRFRLHDPRLPGRPDLVFAGRKKIIFVHGCFWHCHGCRIGKPPKSRLEYWLPKLETNVVRDKLNRAALRMLGWKCLIVWQCELKNTDTLLKRIQRFLDR